MALERVRKDMSLSDRALIIAFTQLPRGLSSSQGLCSPFPVAILGPIDKVT